MPLFDEEAPRPKKTAHAVGEELATLSEDELTARIAILQAEIVRIEQALAAKKASRSTAASFFKS